MIIAIANAIGRNGGIRTDKLVPVNTVAPVISGTALVGNTLTSTTGTWTSDTGVTGYLYQWYRGATLISGATNSTYVLTFADGGFDITCRVAATDTDGTSAYVSSNSILAIDTRLIISVKTNNAGTSASNQFTIPTTGTGYLYDIETSDGQIITGRTGNTTITFPTAGTYDVYISGSFPRFRFNNEGDRLKLLDIKNFGIYAQGSTSQLFAFYGCANMIISATDIGHFKNVNSMQSAFQGCTSLVSIPLINTSNCTNFSFCFLSSGLTSFPALDFSKATTLQRTFHNTNLTSIPLLNTTSCTIFTDYFRLSSKLVNFPANAFDSNITGNYVNAFANTNLSTQSIDNILVSLDTSGITNGTITQSGGVNTPSATGLTAKANLISKGWTVTTN